ncbi:MULTISPECIES: serine/threonine-protein kinase [Brevibacterium]|uniref:non-specific serine/threonine protein kinase n=2 Tax=Brevibacterium casei TaxID=33889 RepID=A0A2H1HUW1_9MICO|nr:serine/threonine-protein kinase [Brevibacterium casei]KZE23379.1 protein kinase [Brevibacterium casei]MBE4694561.1 protein kinase [Brevibacterium casei]MBY3577683.1 protein kinase [Brevibacterium casei]MCT1446345.1 protein kinase [Brevibacterium casei]QPR41117.1 protein kinase [Brevibacterium casei]
MVQDLGGYRLIEELGSGGMGVVYLGVDGGNNPVAVKVLHPHIASDETARKRLAREVRTLRRIRHPRIAEVLDAELDSAQPFIITEFVDGQTLSDDVRDNGPFAEDELVHFGHALLDALGAVHDSGVIHRDLKPANVMIMDGEPMVIDFGIAQVADEVRVTATGLVMGTPGYLSPEIADGKSSSEKTDWWGWAATMAFAATGRNPYGAGPLEAVLGRVALGKFDLADTPRNFVPLLKACLDPKPERRPSGQMILDALVDIESGRMPQLGSGSGPGVQRTAVMPAVDESRSGAPGGGDSADGRGVLRGGYPGQDPHGGAVVGGAAMGGAAVGGAMAAGMSGGGNAAAGQAAAGHAAAGPRGGQDMMPGRGYAPAQSPGTTNFAGQPGSSAPGQQHPGQRPFPGESSQGQRFAQGPSAGQAPMRPTSLHPGAGQSGFDPRGGTMRQATAGPVRNPNGAIQAAPGSALAGADLGSRGYGPGDVTAGGWSGQGGHAGRGPVGIGPVGHEGGGPGIQPGEQWAPLTYRSIRTGGWVVFALVVFAAVIMPLSPLVITAFSFAWSVLARTATRLDRKVQRYRYERGEDGGGTLRSVASAPGALLASVLTSVATFLLPAIAGVAMLVLTRLDVAGIVPGELSEQWSVWAAAAAGGLVLWVGPGAASLRYGSRLIVSGATRNGLGRLIALGVIAVLIVLAIMVITSGAAMNWWPLPESPFAWLPGPV